MNGHDTSDDTSSNLSNAAEGVNENGHNTSNDASLNSINEPYPERLAPTPIVAATTGDSNVEALPESLAASSSTPYISVGPLVSTYIIPEALGKSSSSSNGSQRPEEFSQLPDPVHHRQFLYQDLPDRQPPPRPSMIVNWQYWNLANYYSRLIARSVDTEDPDHPRPVDGEDLDHIVSLLDNYRDASRRMYDYPIGANSPPYLPPPRFSAAPTVPPRIAALQRRAASPNRYPPIDRPESSYPQQSEPRRRSGSAPPPEETPSMAAERMNITRNGNSGSRGGQPSRARTPALSDPHAPTPYPPPNTNRLGPAYFPQQHEEDANRPQQPQQNGLNSHVDQDTQTHPEHAAGESEDSLHSSEASQQDAMQQSPHES